MALHTVLLLQGPAGVGVFWWDRGYCHVRAVQSGEMTCKGNLVEGVV